MKKKLSIILPIFNERDSLPIMVRLLDSSINFKKINLFLTVYKFQS